MYVLETYGPSGRREEHIASAVEAMARYDALAAVALPAVVTPDPLLPAAVELVERHLIGLRSEDGEWCGELEWDGSRRASFESLPDFDHPVTVNYVVNDDDFGEVTLYRVEVIDPEGVRHVRDC